MRPWVGTGTLHARNHRLTIEIIAGIIGGNAAGAGVKNADFGTAGNSIVVDIGGLVLGRILGAMGIGSPEWPRRKEPRGCRRVRHRHVDRAADGDGAGGAVLTLIVGLIRNMMSK